MRRPAPRFEIVVAVLPSAGYAASLVAGEDDLPGLAEATGVARCERVSADIVARRWRREGVEISGRVSAELEQPCIVSLDPVRQSIDAEFVSTFVPAGSALSVPAAGDRELVLDPEGEDPPEEFEGDAIDLWSVVVEWLNLTIDRFPRKPGAEFEAAAVEAADEGRVTPFAALARLKRPQ